MNLSIFNLNKHYVSVPNNIHKITRQRLQSSDFAHKQGLVERMSLSLKKVWGE